MPSCIVKLSLGSITSTEFFDAIPSNDLCDLTHRSFLITCHDKSIKVTNISCENNCGGSYDNGNLYVQLHCAVQHLFTFRINYIVNVVIKAPQELLAAKELSIPGFEDIKLPIDFEKRPNDTYAFWIVNPYRIKINETTGNYWDIVEQSNNFEKTLQFEFDPDDVREKIASGDYLPIEDELSITSYEAVRTSMHPALACSCTSSKSSSTVQTSLNSSLDSSSTTKASTISSSIELDSRYYDVFFKSSDGRQLGSYRCILSKMSSEFEREFLDATRLPVKISAERFHSNVIHQALEFCHGNQASIQGWELPLLKFANAFEITSLKYHCSIVLASNLTNDNIMDTTIAAYLYRIPMLKRACLQYIFEHTNEVPLAAFKTSSPEILYDILTIEMNSMQFKDNLID